MDRVLLFLVLISIFSILTGVYFGTFNILNPKDEFFFFPMIVFGYILRNIVEIENNRKVV